MTGYGSPLLARASAAAPGVWLIPGSGIRRMLRLLRAGLPLLVFYVLALPTVKLKLSDRPTAQVMRDQFNQRRNGRWWFRSAQGVLFLPDSFKEYLRGRHRQAVRTNLRRARESGLTVSHHHVDAWTFPRADPRFITDRPPMPADVWHIHDGDGEKVGEGLITIEGTIAVLHISSTENRAAGWLLHGAIVEWLCGRCEIMIVNAEDVPLLSEGMQHFQRLLGYSIVRLRVTPTREELRRHLPAFRVAVVCVSAVMAILASRWALGSGASLADHALVWVTALTAVRRASSRAGYAALTGVAAALIWAAVGGFRAPGATLSWVIAAFALDVLLARVPRLTWGSFSVAPAGALITVVALLCSRFGRFVAHGAVAYAHGGLWIESVLAGALAAGVGWWVGGRLMRLIPGPAAT